MGLSSTKITLSAAMFHVSRMRATLPDFAFQCTSMGNTCSGRSSRSLRSKAFADYCGIVLAGNADQRARIGEGREKLLIQAMQLSVTREVPA